MYEKSHEDIPTNSEEKKIQTMLILQNDNSDSKTLSVEIRLEHILREMSYDKLAM